MKFSRTLEARECTEATGLLCLRKCYPGAKSPSGNHRRVRGPGEGGPSVKSAPASANRGPGGGGAGTPTGPSHPQPSRRPRDAAHLGEPPPTVSLWLLGACEVGVGRGLCSPCPALHAGPRSQIQTFLQAPSSWGPQPTIVLQSVSPLDHFPPTSSHPDPPGEALPPSPLCLGGLCLFYF